MTPEQALTAHGQGTIPVPASEGLLSSSPTKSPASSPAGLSSREAEVLRLVAQGMTNEQVAEQLDISPRTVNSHLTAIYGKIQVSSTSRRHPLCHRAPPDLDSQSDQSLLRVFKTLKRPDA